MHRGANVGVLVGVVALLAGCEPRPGVLEVVVLETETVTEGTVMVGRGLGTSIALRVPVDPDRDEYEPPTDLEIIPDDPSTVTIEDLGPVGFGPGGSSENEGTVIRITPAAAGAGSIRLFADNAMEDARFSWNALEVDAVAYHVDVQDGNGSEVETSAVPIFADNRALVRAVHSAAGTAVLGQATLELDAPSSSESRLLDLGPTHNLIVDLGNAGHTATVSSPFAPETLIFDVVDTSAIAAIGLRADREMIEPGAAVSVIVGRFVAVNGVPRNATGAEIEGHATADLAFTIMGTAVRQFGSRDTDGVAFEGVSAGSAMVTYQWGTPSVAFRIDVLASR